MSYDSDKDLDDLARRVAERYSERQRQKKLNSAKDNPFSSLPKTIDAIIRDPSISEQQKISVVIHLTGLTCGVVAAQPLPFADIAILTPIQLVMVTALNRIMENPVPKNKTKDLLVSLISVVGWGVLAQQVVLGLYKTALPFLGGITTIPLVYAATIGLGYAAKTVIEARRSDREVSKEEIKRIAEEAKKTAQAEKREWSLDAFSNDLSQWAERGNNYRRYEEEMDVLKRENQALAEQHAQAAEKLNQSNADFDSLIANTDEVEQKRAELERERDELRKRVASIEQRQTRVEDKTVATLRRRFTACYGNVSISDDVLKQVNRLSADEQHLFEKQIGSLQHNATGIQIRCRIQETRIDEIGFADGGRAYILREGNRPMVVRVGNKGSQKRDIDWLRENYPK